MRGGVIHAGQGAHFHAQQAQALVQRHPPQAFAGRAADGGGVRRGLGQGHVARDAGEVGIAQLDAHGAAHVALAHQVLAQALAEPGEDFGQRFAVVFGVQVALEGGFAADGFGLVAGDHGALVQPVRDALEPGGIVQAEMRLQQRVVGGGHLAHGLDAERGQLGVRLGADAVHLAHRQWPDAGGYVVVRDDGQAVGLVQVGTDLRILLQSATDTLQRP